MDSQADYRAGSETLVRPPVADLAPVAADLAPVGEAPPAPELGLDGSGLDWAFDHEPDTPSETAPAGVPAPPAVADPGLPPASGPEPRDGEPAPPRPSGRGGGAARCCGPRVMGPVWWVRRSRRG